MCVCLVNITPKRALFPARGKSRSLPPPPSTWWPTPCSAAEASIASLRSAAAGSSRDVRAVVVRIVSFG